jgi:hypothetical protein
MRGNNGGSVANFGDASKNENFILRPTHLDVNFPKIFSCVAEILDNLAFQRPKRRSANYKILRNSQALQPPTGFFVSFDVSLLGHWAHEFSVVV